MEIIKKPSILCDRDDCIGCEYYDIELGRCDLYFFEEEEM